MHTTAKARMTCATAMVRAMAGTSIPSMSIMNIEGEDNTVADALSHLPNNSSPVLDGLS
jgi:hypothetical protein